MANFPADPRPHFPADFSLCSSTREEYLHRPRAFLGLSADKAFENVAIAHFFPRVSKDDFKPMARALRLHMLTEHNVGTLEVQPCPIGEAFVAFNSPLERRRFLDGPPLHFDGYSVRYVKHDEGENAREYDLDREVWLMLLCHPLDARTTTAIAKAVSGFAMLRHMHESHVMSESSSRSA
jgi:hypothetical protein